MLQKQLFYRNLVAFSYERKNREEHWKVSSSERIFLFYSWLQCGVHFVEHSLAPWAADTSPPGTTGCLFLSFFSSSGLLPSSVVATANHTPLSHPVLCILFSSVTTSINLCDLFNAAVDAYCVLKVFRVSERHEVRPMSVSRYTVFASRVHSGGRILKALVRSWLSHRWLPCAFIQVWCFLDFKAHSCP